jgi:hypothetical protein
MRVLEVQSSRALSFMCGVAYCGTEGRMTIAKQLRRTPNCHPSIHPPTHPRSHPSIHGSLKIEDRVVERDGGRRRPARAVRVRSRVAGVGGCRAARDPSVRRSVGPSVALSSLSSGNIKHRAEQSRAAQHNARQRARQGAPTPHTY